MNRIRLLSEQVANQIAAGEVVERPAAAVKELIENALDAGARRIDVAIEAGGRALIRVADDGLGMDADDLELSVERHATSKIPDGDLANIATLGFRGEALPSIASVSRLEIRSRAHGAEAAFALTVEDGAKSVLRPVAHPVGTRVEARDLFAATPARLKFLKSDRSEAQASADVVRRLALASPGARFSFMSDLGGSFDWPACPAGEAGERERLRQALGDVFVADALRVEAAREGVRISGWVGRRPSTSRTRCRNIFSSTAARRATGCCQAPCAPPRSTSFRATAIASRSCSSIARRARSTSTSIRPRPKCASAIAGSSARC